LAPLELIHSDLCEMNGVLTKGGKKFFMTLIDDCIRFCYIYLLKSKVCTCMHCGNAGGGPASVHPTHGNHHQLSTIIN
jgi:hypothetical protein